MCGVLCINYTAWCMAYWCMFRRGAVREKWCLIYDASIILVCTVARCAVPYSRKIKLFLSQCYSANVNVQHCTILTSSSANSTLLLPTNSWVFGLHYGHGVPCSDQPSWYQVMDGLPWIGICLLTIRQTNLVYVVLIIFASCNWKDL